MLWDSGHLDLVQLLRQTCCSYGYLHKTLTDASQKDQSTFQQAALDRLSLVTNKTKQNKDNGGHEGGRRCLRKWEVPVGGGYGGNTLYKCTNCQRIDKKYK